MPGCELPLNIFEPRYLNMVDDALKADRLIGIIQPASCLADHGAELNRNTAISDLASVGTLGRIKQFSETDDGRYLITLTGLKRFSITGAADNNTPYRQAEIDFKPFITDVDIFDVIAKPQAFTEAAGERAKLTAAMKVYAASLGVEINWKALDGISIDNLVSQTAMISPFEPSDKQDLLEASPLKTRRSLLIGLMHLYSEQAAPENQDKPSSSQQ